MQKLKVENAKQLWDVMTKRVKDAQDVFEATYHLFDWLLSSWQVSHSLLLSFCTSLYFFFFCIQATINLVEFNIKYEVNEVSHLWHRHSTVALL